jgi:CNT family concentrative nucleoside transporter
MMLAAQSLVGLFAFPLIAWILCDNRAELSVQAALRIVAMGLILQFAIAGVLLNVPGSTAGFQLLSDGVAALQSATLAGISVVFGYLSGVNTPFEVSLPQNGFILAFQALPLILLMSVLSRVLYHWGVLQVVVRAFAWMLERTLGVGGPLGTSTAANVFVGMVEAPLLIRPFIAGMSRGALFATMTAGMATVAGTVMALYASILEPAIPGVAGHILAASIMSAPAAIVIARLMVPHKKEDEVVVSEMADVDPPRSTMDAITQGTADGLRLLAFVAAMLVVMVALVALVNMILGLGPDIAGTPLTVERLLGWLCAPLAWATGIPWSEALAAGELIGIKVVLNEFLAYLKLGGLPAEVIAPRSRLILTYALCGFANFGSLGIMIAGLVAMAPERREEIVALGPRTIVSGLLATLMTGAVIGVLTPA